ncbi:glycosyltransferase [Vibrio vulnificus]|uniref:glycosyltransferase family 4 protein n=1 Tax=Vibrio vulnificus TaxID=672 RepID=UPI00307D004E
MKLLRIYINMPPNIGGLEKHVYSLSCEQEKLGILVTHAFNSGSKVFRRDVKVIPYVKLAKIKPAFLRDFIFYTCLMCMLAFRFKRFDVIHIHGDWSAFLFAKLLKKITRSKIVIGSCHGQISPRKKNVNKIAYSMLDGVYTTGLRETQYLKTLIKVRTEWFHSGVDDIFFDKINQTEKFVDVISVGNCLPVKNIDLIINIAEKLPHLSFKHIGSGPLLESLKDRVNENKIGNMKFLGGKSKFQVAEEMKRSKVFLLTSYSEGTPTALLEAKTCGCIVISSPSCQLDSILNSNSDKVINSFDAFDYLEPICNAVSHYSSLRANNSAEFEVFSWANVSKKITEFTLEIYAGKC